MNEKKINFLALEFLLGKEIPKDVSARNGRSRIFPNKTFNSSAKTSIVTEFQRDSNWMKQAKFLIPQPAKKTKKIETL